MSRYGQSLTDAGTPEPVCYANVIIDISHEKVDRPFQYRIPDALLGKIEEIGRAHV